MRVLTKTIRFIWMKIDIWLLNYNGIFKPTSTQFKTSESVIVHLQFKVFLVGFRGADLYKNILNLVTEKLPELVVT